MSKSVFAGCGLSAAIPNAGKQKAALFFQESGFFTFKFSLLT
jgi:hypothetical protein